MIWKIFYNVLVVPALWIGFRTYELFNKKAGRAWKGRKGLFERLQNQLEQPASGGKRIWFHSSSMGEFEQAKPVIAELKSRHPDLQIIVSFFSPSGYEHSLSYTLADVITYIPFDGAGNANRFISIMKPTAAVFVRYDIWPNHLWRLAALGIPTFIVSATLQPKLYRKIPVIRQFVRSLYNTIDYILTVSENDKKVFLGFNVTHPVLEVIGDTRYDQVWKRSAKSKDSQIMNPQIVSGKKVVVIGSSWKEDEERLFPVLKKLFREINNLIVILVPHEPTDESLEFLEKEMNGTIPNIRFSHLHRYSDEKLIFVDSVGNLMSLYQYAHVAYVGGSFGAGIHNVLEPASYGVPVLFGPRHTNSQEAIGMLKEQGALSGVDAEELYRHFKLLLTDEVLRNQYGERARKIIQCNTGVTERFLSYIEQYI